jgi:hypothetical protein
MPIEDILRGISDTRLLSARRAGRSPLGDLIASYSALAEKDPSLPRLHAKSTGRDLKDALFELSSEDQIDLLYTYRQSIRSEDDPWHYVGEVDEPDRKAFRVWFKKTVTITMIVFVLAMSGILLQRGVRDSYLSKTPNLQELLKTVTEIARVIFS